MHPRADVWTFQPVCLNVPSNPRQGTRSKPLSGYRFLQGLLQGGFHCLRCPLSTFSQ